MIELLEETDYMTVKEALTLCMAQLEGLIVEHEKVGGEVMFGYDLNDFGDSRIDVLEATDFKKVLYSVRCEVVECNNDEALAPCDLMFTCHGNGRKASKFMKILNISDFEGAIAEGILGAISKFVGGDK